MSRGWARSPRCSSPSCNFYWAAGGTVGLDDSMGAISERPLFLAYDIAAGLIFVAVGLGAAVLSAGSSTSRVRSRLVTAMWWGGALALARGGLGLVQDVAALDKLDIGAVYDVAFTAGGLIFLRAAGLLGSARRRGP